MTLLTKHQLPPWVASQIPILTNEQLTDVWNRMHRDPELGKLLIDRYAVHLGRDGDRLYVRSCNAGCQHSA